jgi:ABC-type transport system involved in multi-copper enzyme maturation permease subunit
MTLVRHSLRRRRTFLIAGGLFLFAFQIFMILVARAIYRTGGFEELGSLMPNFLEQWTNMVALSFKGMVLFGYSHPLVELFLIAIVIGVATEPAMEIESKFIDLLMARPLRRSAAIVRSMILVLIVTAGAVGSMFLGQWIGLRLFTPATAQAPELRTSLYLVANLAVLILAWGGIALAIAALSRRRATAVAICGFFAFAMFVLDYTGRFWQKIATTSRLSPFHYYSPFPLIGGARLPRLDVIVLVAIFIAGSLVATIAYARRDL